MSEDRLGHGGAQSEQVEDIVVELLARKIGMAGPGEKTISSETARQLALIFGLLLQ